MSPRTPSRRGGVRLDAGAKAVLRAWADLDRFELPEVPTSEEKGWAAVGEIPRWQTPRPWPPRPEKAPERQDRQVLVTRVLFGCLPVAELEGLLDELFPDDLRFRATGVRRRPTTGGALTCRGSFLLDDAGRPIGDSLSYSPLIDFARHVQHHVAAGTPLNGAVGKALRAIDARETKLRTDWERVADGAPENADPAAVVLQLLRSVSVQRDVFRYATWWVPTGQQPAGQLPAFFRDDLLAAVQHPTSPLVGDYLSGRPRGRPATTQDVRDDGVLAELVTPFRMPRAAWPGEHRPRLSQQVAVSAVVGADAQRILSVNGPPGTGKTTLLRDVYANVVTDRAEAMVRYADPAKAFGPRRELPSGTQRTWELHAPAADLCGFEMLVASSNNAAVENVSRELPSLDKVDPGLRDVVSYFRPAANPEPPSPKGAVPRRTGRPGLLAKGEAWGFAAAVLGSRDRVSAFTEVVDRYRTARGTTDLLSLLGAGATDAQWAAARRRFREARQAVERRCAELAEVAEGLAVVDDLAGRREAERRAVEDAERALTRATEDVGRARQAVADHEGPAAAAVLAVEGVSAQRPGALSRWLQTEAAASWSARMAAAEEAAETAARELEARRVVLARVLGAEEGAREAARAAAAAQRAAEERLRRLQAAVAACPERVDAAWWQRPRAARESGPAWIDADLQRMRGELFAAAMHVHEVFARRAGTQMQANLRTWMALQTNEVETTVAREVTLAAWQAFFLLVPLASTTFASMARLLRDVPTGSLGWLIVDEAGQAVPSAAVGGLARFRRAVVVGDPQQLEPVVTLPDALVAQLMRHHGAAAELAPNRASVQTLTDSITRFGTERLGTWLGLPLLVHNRCLEPMFSIANEIAYAGEMISGRLEPGPDDLMGPSRWIDLPRPDGAHFRTEDAERVLELLRRVDWAVDQSIAIISPFKEVVRGLRRPVEREVLALLPPERRSKEGREKALDSVRVGTVHTFQGQEKTAVVLVLGGGSNGARAWAAGSPNLLNVAVTRAQDRLYVVGDRSAWADVGHARTLAEWLPFGPD
ncbi:DEAD/DEAH box helicase [Geodermatophilus sp. DSM 45219]|uniref:DEAD/DEAH box helicase n=1 Tax=Geodermatophilus sp. DSM 45219 TaxID=1881103 RepID=UPI00087E0841|nr:ATP-binding protein [Geodermatophilus sp. DSM 45219]SDO46449.1 Part of AAA domain-containing protein [Geodermatophilus sp. DSM 45219]